MPRPTYDEWCEDWFLAGLTDGHQEHTDIDPQLLKEYEERLEREAETTETWEEAKARIDRNIATLLNLPAQ